MNALVLGANGQLGTELVRLLGRETAVSHDQVSVTEADAVEGLIADRAPEVVFNCAAYNGVDRAEDEPDVAMRVNRDGAANVAASCRRHGARLVHFSTNFVFDGGLDRDYLEADQPHPLGAYGRSKYAGEGAVLAADPGALVVRTAAVYGRVGTGFPDRIVQRVRTQGHLEMVSDQRVNPTSAQDLAERVVTLAGGDLVGLIHLVAAGCCSWEEFARAVLDEVGLVAPIRPVASDQLQMRARRPLNGCLASSRVEPLRPWREGVREWVQTAKNP